jgi:hypothetical protein
MNSVVPILSFVIGLASSCAALAQLTDAYEEAPIRYSATTPRDAVSRLEARLASGEVRLGTGDREIVRTLLRELRVPVESQLLVFSKTSLQRDRIDPRHPRAIYFSDDCYVGWCPGGLVEVVPMDPELGPVFYAFDPRKTPERGHPRFVRDQDCLSCHGGNFVRGIPGVFARSVPTDESGEPLLRLGSEVVDYRTPFAERWGGWYVTGKHGASLHQGNVFSRDDDGRLDADFSKGANVTDLSPFFDGSRYLARTSDLVALMVFEHQTDMHNAITRAGFAVRRMQAYQETLQRELNEPVTEEPSYDSVKRVFDHSARDVVDALLFKDEAALPEGGIEGMGAFQKVFLAGALRTRDGLSLKDLDLRTRLFRNRCSYLIYSKHFQALPVRFKRLVYQKLEAALKLRSADERYDYLGNAERSRIATILRETLPDLPEGWLAPTPGG